MPNFNTISVVADFIKQLSQSVSISETTAVLNNGLDADGNQLTNDRLYGFTIDSGSKKEYIVATLSSNNQLSGVFSISRQGVATSGFAKNHQVGASVIISDWASLSYITKVLNGDTDLQAGTPLKYGGTPAQTNPLALATVQYVLDTASGSTVLAFNPQTIDGQATNVADGDWVYFDEATGLWEKTDADDIATSVNVKIGKARGTVSSSSPAGIPGGVFVSGTETLGTYVAGTIYYIGNTAGALATSPGTNSVKVGVGDANGDLVMLHLFPQEVTQAQKDALAGTGTPSGSNKFVTADTLNENLPPGSVQMYAGASAPTGWLLCDASAVSRTTYAALFAIISTTYGVGDGSTTFNVPDMRGRVPVGVGTGTGDGASGTGLPTGGGALTAVARATWKGKETHTLSEAEMPAHNHAIPTFQSPNAGFSGAATGAFTTAGGNGTSDTKGSSSAHNNTQPVMGLNFIIKT
jgi:microcystin-dependent protein